MLKISHILKTGIIVSFIAFFIECKNSKIMDSSWTVINDNDSEIRLGQDLSISLRSIPETHPEKVIIKLTPNEILYEGSKTEHLNIPTDKIKRVGVHKLIITLHKDNQTLDLIHYVTIKSNVKAKLLGYEIVRTYPHDAGSFCQGLEYNYNKKNTFYESTGLYGRSKLKIVQLINGKSLKEISLEPRYFAEGLTIFRDKLLLLTWREHVGFVYDPKTLNKERTFTYAQSKEGWGLTNDGETIYKSDGTEKIWILDPLTFTEIAHIQVYDDEGPVKYLNELEFVEGKIYANIWKTNKLAVINPHDGIVENYIDLAGLLNPEDIEPTNAVLNGIAYDKDNKRLFVTGKLWPNLFEIRVKAL